MTEDIKKACEVMAAGGIILYPTDTIWELVATLPMKSRTKSVRAKAKDRQ